MYHDHDHYSHMASGTSSYHFDYPVYDLSGMSSRLRQDMDTLSSLYPHKINELKQLVAAECDRMDYKGSMMYDECPDKVMFSKKCGELCKKADCQCQYAKECNDKNFLKDMVSVLLAEEMSKRRKKQNKSPFLLNPPYYQQPPQPPKPPHFPQPPQPPQPPYFPQPPQPPYFHY